LGFAAYLRWNKVSRDAVRLEVWTDQPLTRAQLDDLDGGRHQLQSAGRPRGRSDRDAPADVGQAAQAVTSGAGPDRS
jgi:hypothetical protein